MPPTRSEIDAQLAELYAQIPANPDCDGRCWTSCGPIDMSDRERQRIRAAGVRITPYEQAKANLDRFWCDALTGDKRCAVYELRPLVCRLWGVVESMPCVYGCRPDGRYLTDIEAYRLIAESMRIGGGKHPNSSAAEIDEGMARESLRMEVQKIMARGPAAELSRASEQVPAAFRRR
jgi:hypothetical protein